MRLKMSELIAVALEFTSTEAPCQSQGLQN